MFFMSRDRYDIMGVCCHQFCFVEGDGEGAEVGKPNGAKVTGAVVPGAGRIV